MVEMHIPGDKVLVLQKEGEVDSAALLAFLGGHCHSMALALNARTGWPFVAVDNASGECVHVAVQAPDGRIVDITGGHTPREMTEAIRGGGAVRFVTTDYLERLRHEHGWIEPAPQVAAAWIKCVLARMAAQPLTPMKIPTMKLRQETLRGIEVEVSWDGEPEFVVDVRRARGHRSPWTRYGRVAFPKEADGTWRLEFTCDRFRALAETWLKRSFDESRAEQALA